MQDPCQLEFYSKTCPVLLTSEHTCGTCKITDASAATNLLRPLLLLTPRCLILSFFLVAAPSMTSSPSPFSRAWQTTALSRTPLCKREYGLFDHLSYILPSLPFDLLSPKVIRGTVKLERYNIRNSSTSGSRSCFYTSDESYQCPLSYGV